MKPNPDFDNSSDDVYAAIAKNLKHWLEEKPERIHLFDDFVENPTIEKIVDQVNKKTPVGMGIAVEVINVIFK